MFDKSQRNDGTFSRADFVYDHAADAYTCPGGKQLKFGRRAFKVPRTAAPPDDTIRYLASKHDCEPCALKPVCCPGQPFRKVTRSIHEGARDFARDIAKTDAYVTSRASGRRSRCSSPTSSGSSGSIGCACAAPAAPETSSPRRHGLRKLAKRIPPRAQACPA